VASPAKNRRQPLPSGEPAKNNAIVQVFADFALQS